MRLVRRFAWLTILPLAFTGCGEDKGPAAEPSSADTTATATQSVLVALADSIPMEVFGNNDDQVCLVRDSGVEVTLRDADGTIIGTEPISGVGGSWQDGAGCLWEVSFTSVPASDFYEATLKAGDFERTGTVKAESAALKIVIEF